ncbi:MAG TPA: alpha/beta hydrolase [Chitinophagaceae bacterium]|nr:alpha/beta hydrolase [Chitinophagaceae bacterium]
MGNRTVLCFHGFGTFARTFDWLATRVPNHVFIAFDLPFHGETTWENGELFQPNDLLNIISLCPHANQDQFALMGYSMGGRISLHLVEIIPERITNLVLLAPDGLHVNPWYWFSTQTRIGNRFFRKVMKEPAGFINLLKHGERFRLLNKGVLKFIDRYMGDPHIREHVYRVWTSFRKFKPNKNKIIDHINRFQIPVSLIYGKYDTIIPLSPGETFFHHLKSRKKLEVLESGHQILHIRNAEVIAEAFKYYA